MFDQLLEPQGFDASQAACAGLGVEIFFPEDIPGIAVAKEVCAGCPVRVACLQGAIERKEAAGVWGGELFEEGKVIAQKRPRGRPRKVAIEVAA